MSTTHQEPGQRPEVTVRVWCSPRLDKPLPWCWAVDLMSAPDITKSECLEFGYEATEADARHEATEARDHWESLLAEDASARAQQQGGKDL